MEETRLLGNMSVRECGSELSAPAERAGQGRPGRGGVQGAGMMTRQLGHLSVGRRQEAEARPEQGERTGLLRAGACAHDP